MRRVVGPLAREAVRDAARAVVSAAAVVLLAGASLADDVVVLKNGREVRGRRDSSCHRRHLRRAFAQVVGEPPHPQLRA